MKIVYIDTQNIHKGVQSIGRVIDRALLYEYLQNKFAPDTIKMFIGYLPHLENLYKKMANIGYKLVFKQTSIQSNGSIKGNIDVDLTMHVMDDLHLHFLDKAFIISGDGDFNTLVERLKNDLKLGRLIVPNLDKTTSQLRHASGSNIQSLKDLSHLISKKETSTEGDTLLGGRKLDSLSSGEQQ